MDAYIFQAALLCPTCAREVMGSVPIPPQMDPLNEHTWDSDDYPKGPYANGGGEADTPQHCDHCGVFLENDLTGDGEEYVMDALSPYVNQLRSGGYAINSKNISYMASISVDLNHQVLAEWAEYYDWIWENHPITEDIE